MERHPGERAIALLKQLTRHEQIPPYDQTAVESIIQEMNSLWSQLEEVIANGEGEPEATHAGYLLHFSLNRNKRVTLAYLYNRLQRILRLRWELLGNKLPQSIVDNCSASERSSFEVYDKLLTEYMTSIDLDLTIDTQPPKDLYIQIRVLEDCGELQTGRDFIDLRKNSMHYLRRSDAEQFIKQGKAEHIG